MLAALLGPLAAFAAEPPAAGLIVRLQGAAAHERTVQTEAAARGETEHWQRLLRDAGVDAAVRRVPVGRDQQRLDFGRPLAATEVRRLADRLRARPDVAWVEADTLEQPLQAASDPMVAQQWWLRAAGGANSNAPEDRLRGVPGFLTAWQNGLPAAADGVTVAVLDTGVTNHPELAGRLLPGYDFVSDPAYANDGNGRDADPSDPGDWVSDQDLVRSAFSGCRRADSSWHGTIVTGLIAAAADNDRGIAGIASRARVLPVRVAGKCGATLSDIVDGMRWAAGLAVPGVARNPNPARIVNISFGGLAACGRAYQEAVDELHAAGVVVVAAGGNDAGAAARPANCRGVVGVVALNRDGFKTRYSSFGSAFEASGIATVGGDNDEGRWGALLADGGLLALFNEGARAPAAGSYANVFGTSFAAPMVAGTAALMLGVNPRLGADDLVRGLRLSARPHVTSPLMAACSGLNPGRCLCSSATCGAGILDADQALRFAADPAAYTPPPRSAEVIQTAELEHAAALGADVPASEAPQGQAEASSGADTGGGALDLRSLLWLAFAVAALAGLSGAARRERKAR